MKHKPLQIHFASFVVDEKKKEWRGTKLIRHKDIGVILEKVGFIYSPECKNILHKSQIIMEGS